MRDYVQRVLRIQATLLGSLPAGSHRAGIVNTLIVLMLDGLTCAERAAVLQFVRELNSDEPTREDRKR